MFSMERLVVGLVLIPELRKPQDKEKDSEGRGNA